MPRLHANLLPHFRIHLFHLLRTRGRAVVALIVAALWVTTIPGSAATATNIAFNKPVTSSGPTWGGLVPSALTDLGRTYRLDRIAIYNRADGCCPDRLSKYGVEVYADQGGSPGPLNWSTGVRTNGSNSGVAGVDNIRASASTNGVFFGRFIRIVNRSDIGFSPQVAEVQVYGALPPVVRSFTADEDVLSPGQSTAIRWDVAAAMSVSISPGIGEVSPTNGSVVIHPAVSTTYTLTATNLAGPFSTTLNVGVGVLLGPPRISEFMTSNAGVLKDEDGDSSDWIELQNTNSYGLKLEGYSLTDDPTLKSKWTFPASRVPANGYLVVFASGKDRANSALGPLHTNFKLSSSGGYLALLDKDGATVLQQFPSTFPNPAKYPKQRSNNSYGLDVSNQEGFFRPATPGAQNGPAFAGLVADVTIDPGHGFFSNAVDVVLACSTKGATIRYTTNNTEPTATTGLVYQQPIHVTNTAVLRAAAFRDGWGSSPIETRTYVYLSNVITSKVMSTAITKSPLYGPQMLGALTDLPSISIVAPDAINDTTEVRCSFEWLDPNGAAGVQVPCGARYFGGAFTAFEKKSFRFVFRSEYGASKLSYPMLSGFDHGLTPVEEFDEIELRSGSHDMSMRGFYMSNPCADDTLLDMGRLNPHGRFVHMYLNGVYWGMFHLRERWSAHMHARYTGGLKEDYESINGNWNVGGWADPGVPYDGDGSIWEKAKVLKTNYNMVKVWVDVPQYVDYMLTFMFGGCEDEYRCVGPNTPGSGFKYYLNDADGWFCGTWYCAADDRTSRGAPGRSAGDGPGSIFSMLYKEGNPEYRTLLADRIYSALFRDGPLTPNGVLRRLNSRCNEIERAFLAESARWNYLTPSDWAARRDEVKTSWLPHRTSEVLGQWR
ncbi:MAG: CotH kinase family protein, partial [Verrucomicrobia bacterium]|nr:CotH kinase family protein [Verrucomicrobiota bacterium]